MCSSTLAGTFRTDLIAYTVGALPGSLGNSTVPPPALPAAVNAALIAGASSVTPSPTAPQAKWVASNHGSGPWNLALPLTLRNDCSVNPPEIVCPAGDRMAVVGLTAIVV